MIKLNLPLQLAICQQLLPYQKERQQVQTGSGLQEPEQMDHPEQIPPPSDFGTYSQPCGQKTILQI